MLRNTSKMLLPILKQTQTPNEAAHVTCATFWTKHALENESCLCACPLQQIKKITLEKYITPPLALFSQNKKEYFLLTPCLKWGKIAHTLCASQYLFETLGN